MHRKNQPGTIPHLPALDEIRHLLNTGLHDHWFIRVEHADQMRQHAQQWEAWNPSRFTPDHTQLLLEDIHNCHARHPGHTIRLHAERTQPYTRMVYWINLPENDSEGSPGTRLPMMRILNGGREGNTRPMALGLMMAAAVLLASYLLIDSPLFAV